MKLKLTSLLAFALISFLSPQQSEAAQQPLALVWYGPGACKPGCAPGAVIVAKQAGYRVKKVYPGFKDYELFKEAKLWVQPGGKSTTSAEHMGPELLDQVRQFVYNGGGYVGFCAGLFITTSQIGTSGKVGYGIVPGSSELYLKHDPSGVLLPVKTKFGTYRQYYSGGPQLNISQAELSAANGVITSLYSDGKVAGVNLEYGKGRVSVIGTHPEAGWLWRTFKAGIDRDGSDRWFAREMIKYATGKTDASAMAITSP